MSPVVDDTGGTHTNGKDATMTEYSDWRTGPPPRPCAGCGAVPTACQSRHGFTGQHCCDNCQHPIKGTP